MSLLDREVAGLRCRDVLAVLGDYVDGDLPPEEVERVEGHLRGCDRCERFGGRYGALVSALRDRLVEPDPEMDEDLRDRLDDRMGEVWEEEGA